MNHFMDRLVEKAMLQSQSFRVAKMQLKSAWSPDIAISRDPGSGGRFIAKKIATKLGWKLFDKALMFKLSEELGIKTAELEHIDEHGRTWFADTFHSIFNPAYVSDVRYITNLKIILQHASKQGDLVILGRGANHILPPDKCLRVRITAPFTTRVKNTLKYDGKRTKLEAVEWVRHIESQRNRFIRQYFGVNPHNPWNYDLVISTDQLTLDQAANLIIQAYLIKFPQEKKPLANKI